MDYDLKSIEEVIKTIRSKIGNKRNNLKVIFFVAIISLVAGFLGGFAGIYVYLTFKGSAPLVLNNSTLIDSQEQAVIQVVKDVSPAVVSIVISKDVPVFEKYYINPFKDFERFFGQLPFDPVPQYRQKGTQKQEIGGGTGVIVSDDGLILTNKHVVSDTQAEYTVYTNDGKKYPAKVLARDPVQDLAIIKIDPATVTSSDGQVSPHKFTVAKLGSSDSAELGESVIAIGNALGEFRNTISLGVISGLGRTISASSGGAVENLENVIQTDAAINPGNSGGPLINLKGEVIGLNTAIAQGAQSIGFAIPIDRAKRDISQIQSIGKIAYPFLGVRYLLINDSIKTEKKLSVDYGALISSGSNGESAITSGSPADSAGLKEGDIILEINGEKITQDNSLSKIIANFNPGDKVSLKILRGKDEINVDVILNERV